MWVWPSEIGLAHRIVSLEAQSSIAKTKKKAKTALLKADRYFREKNEIISTVWAGTHTHNTILLCPQKYTSQIKIKGTSSLNVYIKMHT